MQLRELLINRNPTEVKIEVATTFIQRFKGWMGKKEIPQKGLLLYPCNCIHTFLMKFPIDAIFLDSQNKVIKIYKNLAPWRVIPIINSAVNVLELPSGWADKLSISVGDQLSFQNNEIKKEQKAHLNT